MLLISKVEFLETALYLTTSKIFSFFYLQVLHRLFNVKNLIIYVPHYIMNMIIYYTVRFIFPIEWKEKKTKR